MLTPRPARGYGTSRIDFGRIKDGIAVYKKPHDIRTQFSPDGYSTYTSLSGNYICKMPFRREARAEKAEIADKLITLASTIDSMTANRRIIR